MLKGMFFAGCYCPNFIPSSNHTVLDGCRHRICLTLGECKSISLLQFATMNQRVDLIMSIEVGQVKIPALSIFVILILMSKTKSSQIASDVNQ